MTLKTWAVTGVLGVAFLAAGYGLDKMSELSDIKRHCTLQSDGTFAIVDSKTGGVYKSDTNRIVGVTAKHCEVYDSNDFVKYIIK